MALGVVVRCAAVRSSRSRTTSRRRGSSWWGCVGGGAGPLAAYNAAGEALAHMDARRVRGPEAYADALAEKREAENALLGGMVRVTAQVSRVNSELLRQGLVTDGGGVDRVPWAAW